MRRYKRYMDGVEVSDTLHEKLKNLKAPEKRPNPWLKWGGLAAAVALVIGVGAWAAGLPTADQPAVGPLGPGEAAPGIPWPIPDPGGVLTTGVPEPAEPAPDPNDPEHVGKNPGVDPGYWLAEEETQAYYFLPALNWLDASGLDRQDYALAPSGALYRDAVADDVTALCGGEEAMKDHLLWDGLDWGGVLWFLEDGTPQAASVYADGDGLFLSLEIMKGGEVPSCIVFPDEDYQYTEWQGVEITALKNTGYCVLDDGTELREGREVSFVADGVGYKLGLYTDDAERAGELCARFVRYAIDGGFDLDVLPADGAVNNTGYSVGEPRWNDGGEAPACDPGQPLTVPSELPDKGTPPPEMPTADIIHPGEEGYVEPFPEP